jgi:hypothetical protein
MLIESSEICQWKQLLDEPDIIIFQHIRWEKKQEEETKCEDTYMLDEKFRQLRIKLQLLKLLQCTCTQTYLLFS